VGRPSPLSSRPQLGFPNILFPSAYLTKWLIKMVGCLRNMIINYANKICFCHLFLFSPAGNWPTSLAEAKQMAPFIPFLGWPKQHPFVGL